MQHAILSTRISSIALIRFRELNFPSSYSLLLFAASEINLTRAVGDAKPYALVQ